VYIPYRGYNYPYNYPQYDRPLVHDIAPEPITGTVTTITPPAVEPVSLLEAKQYARISVDALIDDDIISKTIKGVRQRIEELLDRSLITQILAFNFENFTDNKIYLPRGPVQHVTFFEEIKSDSTSAEISTDHYVLNIDADPAEIKMKTIPTKRDQYSYFKIHYVTGYGATGSYVPQMINLKILEAVTILYDQRILDFGSLSWLLNVNDIMPYKSVRPI
jgi:uncharacterized phiE125 gp8 family phage protein